MSGTVNLPRRFLVLGDAMRGVLMRLKTEMELPLQPSVPVAQMSDVIASCLDQHASILERMAQFCNSALYEVCVNENVRDADVHRAADGFGSLLSELLSLYHQVRQLKASGPDAEGRALLEAVHRHSLVEIRRWLENLIEAIADPLAAVKKRGLPTSGNVDIPLTLVFAPPPQLPALSAWAKRQQEIRARAGLGFWGTLSVVALGWFLGGKLFGRKRCR